MGGGDSIKLGLLKAGVCYRAKFAVHHTKRKDNQKYVYTYSWPRNKIVCDDTEIYFAGELLVRSATALVRLLSSSTL